MNGHPWTAPVGDAEHGDETVKVMLGVASGHVSQQELTEWVRQRLGGSP